MAFPNTLFPLISLNTDVSNEEYRLFHSIDIKLVKILIRRLGRNPFDAINVVAFLLWLETSRLCVNAVYKLVNLYWPDYLLGMLADQAVALLGWLENPTLVLDISLIEKLCDREVGLVELQRRRLEILDETRKIVQEIMRPRDFEDEFGRELENDNGVGFAAEPAYDAPEFENHYQNGVGTESGGSSFYDPRERMNRYYNGGQFRNARGFVRDAAGSVHVPQELWHSNQFGVRLIPHPQELQIRNDNGVGFGSANGLVHGHRDDQDMNGGRQFTNGPILPDVAVGPRIGRKMRNYQGQEMGSTSGDGGQTKHPARRPIPEHRLSVLLSGLNVTQEATDVHYDDRTVFLTFSKGYPVTEAELWNFFTRRFGNFIRAIYFEQVQWGVQPLFARMVARNTSILPLICDANSRTKYIINGKHVWAKKFVRMN